MDAGKSLILAAAPDASETIRSLALECGVELDDRGTSVFDHFNYQAANGATDPTAVLAQDIVDSPAIISKAVEVRMGLEVALRLDLTAQPSSTLYNGTKSLGCSKASWFNCTTGACIPSAGLHQPQPTVGASKANRDDTLKRMSELKFNPRTVAYNSTTHCMLTMHAAVAESQAPVIFQGVAATVPANSELVGHIHNLMQVLVCVMPHKHAESMQLEHF